MQQESSLGVVWLLTILIRTSSQEEMCLREQPCYRCRSPLFSERWELVGFTDQLQGLREKYREVVRTEVVRINGMYCLNGKKCHAFAVNNSDKDASSKKMMTEGN